jgi:CubicO group peptidase (beta-lactamase class C family)
MEASGTPGMSVAVGVDGRVVWSEGFGYADVENRSPVLEATRFRIGSVSKPLTAAALAQLLEAGRVDLDAPVQRYVPSFPEKRWPITTRQLAGHLSGIRHYNGDEFLNGRRYDTVVEGLEIFQDDTLLFEPGARYSYSSYAWNLISAVVEGASGEDFLTYMQENVFRPLELEATVADHTDSIIPHRTRYYQRQPDGRVLNAPYVDNSYKWAGGGFLSTPADLVRFGMAHMHDGFLNPETLTTLWTSQRTRDGEETGYGIGWRVGTDREGRRIVSHGGGSVGGTTFLLLFPDDGLAIATVGNMSQAPNSLTNAWALADGFLNPPADEAAPISPTDVSGSFRCTVTARGEDFATQTFKLGGEPGEYWGWSEWEILEDGQSGRERVVASYADPEQIRIITVGERGYVSYYWLRADGDGLSGEWLSGGRGEMSCTKA